MLPDHRHRLSLIGMTQVRQNDPAFRILDGDGVQMPGQGGVQRSPVDESCPRVEQDGQLMADRILPQVIQLRGLRIESGIHGHQLDAPHLQILVALLQFLLPTRLGRIQGEKRDQVFGVLRTIFGDEPIGSP